MLETVYLTNNFWSGTPKAEATLKFNVIVKLTNRKLCKVIMDALQHECLLPRHFSPVESPQNTNVPLEFKWRILRRMFSFIFKVTNLGDVGTGVVENPSN